MKLTDYISDRIFSIVCFVVAEGLLFGLLWLIEVPSVLIAFANVIFLFFFLASFIWDFHRRSRYYNRLLRILEQLDEKTLLMEVAERPTFWMLKLFLIFCARTRNIKMIKLPKCRGRAGITGIFRYMGA